MKTLIIAEVNDKGLKPTVPSLVTAAKKVEGEIELLLIGNDADATESAQKLEGVSKIYVNQDRGENVLSETLTNAVVNLIKNDGNYTHIYFESSSFGKSVMPRVAALLNVAPLSDVISIVDEKTFVRPIFAGSIEATVENNEPIKIASIRATAFEPCSNNGQASVEMMTNWPAAMNTRKVSFDAVKTDRPSLQSAKIVVAGGRGLDNAEGFEKLVKLADKLGAAVGATRAVVDMGLCPNDWQIGQTGKVIAPDLYIAIGISGAMQHIAGIKDAKVVVAINNDPEAAIFEVADYGLVMDAKAGIDALLAELN